jgi:hypothetical protein
MREKGGRWAKKREASGGLCKKLTSQVYLKRGQKARVLFDGVMGCDMTMARIILIVIYGYSICLCNDFVV